MHPPSKPLVYETENHLLLCQGEWDILNLSNLITELQQLHLPPSEELTVDGGQIEKMDSAGAWLLLREIEAREVTYANFSKEHQELIALIKSKLQVKHEQPPAKSLHFLARVGRDAIHKSNELLDYIAFVGKLTIEAIRITITSKRFRWRPLSRTLFDTGYTALPIIALLSFMIGIVITYQMGLQLKNYGANVYIVDLLGISILREFSPLLTAIMVAGRTGSSYTAQLGIMRINQEIDALDTMGVTPAEILLLPKITGLFIALPLLTMWSNIFGILGGMVMSASTLNLTWYDFLHRFQHVVGLKNLIIGLGKAPIFAMIIASIACYQGMNVRGSAESIGRNTTRSVVLAIFFIIVADAAFSIIFSKLKL